MDTHEESKQSFDVNKWLAGLGGVPQEILSWALALKPNEVKKSRKHCEGFVSDTGCIRGGNQELHATGADALWQMAKLVFQLQLAGEAESPGNTLETGRRYVWRSQGCCLSTELETLGEDNPSVISENRGETEQESSPMLSVSVVQGSLRVARSSSWSMGECSTERVDGRSSRI